jgi:hypothetical protein
MPGSEAVFSSWDPFLHSFLLLHSSELRKLVSSCKCPRTRGSDSQTPLVPVLGGVRIESAEQVRTSLHPC